MKITNLIATIVTSLSSLPLLLAQQPALPGASALGLTAAPSDQPSVETDRPISMPGPFSRAGAANAALVADVTPAWVGAATRTPASQVSVLCFKDPNQKELRETTEDIAVLAFLFSRNLDQAVSEDTTEYKLGIPMLLSANQAVGASYIQDFGALLKMQVRFPVAAPVNGRMERKTAQTSEWESARRELIAQDSGTDYFPLNNSKRGPEGPPYDPALVQTLQKRILVLLKNASNIRHLKGNEWVVVKVVGTPCSSIISRVADDQPIGREPSESKPSLPSKRSQRNGATGGKSANVDSVSTQNQTTVLTLRVTKADADAFAAGSVSEEQFIQSAEVAAYFSPLPSEAGSRSVAYEGLKK